MKKPILLFAFAFASTLLFAQGEGSAFTATGRAGVSVTLAKDYQSIGINPANLGMFEVNPDDLSQDHKFSLGLAEFTASVHSDALSRPDLRQNFFSVGAFSGNNQLTMQQKLDAAQAFASAGVSLNADIMAFGFSVAPKREVGAFAISIRDRFSSSFGFNQMGAGIIFQGFNYNDYFDSLAISGTDTTGYSTNPLLLSDVFDSSHLRLNWYRELNFSYGRVIIDNDKFSLYGGVGIKYLMGIGYLDVNVDNGFNAFTALGPVFGINYSSATTGRDVTDGNFITSVGKGLGFDVGLTLGIGMDEKLKIGVSLTDIGSIKWDGNVYTAQDTLFNGLSDNGLDSYNFFDQAQNIAGDSGFFNWAGASEVKSQLATRLRMGASYRVNNKFEVGADFLLPVNDMAVNMNGAMLGVGFDVRPAKFLRLSSGFSWSSRAGVNVPIGLYFTAGNGNYEIGIASRDAITFFAKNTPTLSLALGLFRFHF